jgi:hypothetical protein
MSLSARLRQQSSKLPVNDEVGPSNEAPVDYEELSLELPVVSGISEEKSEETYDYIIFVADYKLTSDIASKLDKFLNIKEYSESSFKNRDFNYLKEQQIHYIWIDLHQDGARDWLRRNVKVNDGYKMILTFSVKQSKWVADLEPYADLIISKKKIGDASFLTLGELMSEIRDSVIKIHKPLGGCFDKFLFKNRLVQEKKT